MHPIFKNILAIIAGLISGSVVNMSIIMISGSIIPPPEGADVTTMEGLLESMNLFQPRHFIMPFLAHALGTFFGALVAGLINKKQAMRLAMMIGGFFLLGGAINVFLLPSPLWFSILDIGVAYIPMAYIAAKLVSIKS